MLSRPTTPATAAGVGLHFPDRAWRNRSPALALLVLPGVAIGGLVLRCAAAEAVLKDADTLHRIPLERLAQAESTKRFESIPSEQSGIDLVYRFPANAPFELLQDQGCASGVCIGDFDSDGHPDLYLTHYNQGNRLYRGLGSLRFEDVTRQAGVDGAGRWSAGATFVDIDNDGDLDLYVCAFNAPNLLYLNQGNGVFEEAAQRFGLDFKGASVMMAFADYDRDGLLDGYLVTHRLNVGTDHRLPQNSAAAFKRAIIRVKGGQVEVDPAYQELFGTIPKGKGRTELIIAGQADYLYHNEGNGRFKIVNQAAGIHGNDIGLAATWWDYNDDGYPDIYVSNDYKGPDRLYRNNQDGTFTDVARSALPHLPWSSMGTDTADVNNDGRIDLMGTEMAGSTHYRRMSINGDLPKERWFLTASEPPQYQRNTLFLSTGTERVLEAACLAGVDSTDWTWSPKFGDLDNDGQIDLFIANGMSRDFVNADGMAAMRDRSSRNWLKMPVLREENLAFRNLGDLRFESVGAMWGLNQRSASFGAALGDLDRDGDLDLVVGGFEEPVLVLRNGGKSGERVLIRLKGVKSNSWGIGAKIQLTTVAGMQTRYVSLASGMMSANEPILHFGLGEHKLIEQLLIEWPSGHRQTFTELPAGYFYTVTERDTSAPAQRLLSKPWFAELQQTHPVQHREREFDDFAREPLLPWKLSNNGPGLAVSDVDGDGDEDLYLGGAASQSGMLCLNNGQGQFRPAPMSCFEADREAEDMGAVFFDSDRDGDLDLYVVSGGVEAGPDDLRLRDRLYLNDGLGRFSRAPDGAVPDLRDSGSCVAAADFDRDGDLDLFVGSRSVPGRYPEVPSSRLLRNDQGKFTEITRTAASGLVRAGLVTGAIWSDANNDGWVDLLVSREWSTIGVYLNREGQLKEHSDAFETSPQTGWWNAIAAADVDRDADIDYIVTNFGLNSPYQASPERPCLAFLVPLQAGNQFIEARFEGATIVPVRRRETFLELIPSLVERFPNYQTFASAALKDILGPEILNSTTRLEVTTLASGVLLNDGHARFTFVPLPRVAQIAPASGVVVTDFNNDSKPDIYLAQNFFGPQPETGRMNAGVGQLLLGNGNGTFRPVDPATSGMVVAGDAKSAALTDFNNDGRADVIVALNDGPLRYFRNEIEPAAAPVRIQLKGNSGNSAGVGARITLRSRDGSTQSAEIHAGSGYLSQSSSAFFLGGSQSNPVREITVRWPNGRSTTTTTIPSTGVCVLRQDP